MMGNPKGEGSPSEAAASGDTGVRLISLRFVGVP